MFFPIQHPLDPLTVEEIAAATTLARTHYNLGKQFRFPIVVLNEPPKNLVLNFQLGDPITREA